MQSVKGIRAAAEQDRKKTKKKKMTMFTVEKDGESVTPGSSRELERSGSTLTSSR